MGFKFKDLWQFTRNFYLAKGLNLWHFTNFNGVLEFKKFKTPNSKPIKRPNAPRETLQALF